MQRLQLGDDYESSGSEKSDTKESDWSAQDEQEMEAALRGQQLGDLLQNASSQEQLGDGLKSVKSQSQAPLSMAADNSPAMDDLFNPLRFIALHLKELNEIDKQQK